MLCRLEPHWNYIGTEFILKNTENYKKLERCFETYKEKIKFTPEIALVLGSGLNFFAEKMKIVA